MRHDDEDTLRRRIAELEQINQEQDAELTTAKALLAVTWPGNEVPSDPVPAELTHALHGPRQTVRLIVDGRPVWAGVRAKRAPDAVRELEVWGAIVRFARRQAKR